jgi:ATP-dependent DNA helicase RecG
MDGLPTHETHLRDHKSLRKVEGSSADFDEFALDCVCFANGSGGVLLVGIESRAVDPPADQRIGPQTLDNIRRRVGELTRNVQVNPRIATAANGGEYIIVEVPRASGVASTSDGRYRIRVGDTCQPVVGDDVLRLITDRPVVPWEMLTTARVARDQLDAQKIAAWCGDIRSSDRVKDAVKEKNDRELLVHYRLCDEGFATNLGILLLGKSRDRARLATAPVVQAIKYDDRGAKVGKFVWDDHELSPVELVDAVWSAIPDFRESYEVESGLFRTTVPAFDEVVVRELLVNALVHRPYTQGGEIFLNIRPTELEIVNPGRLPIGVTPQNILHAHLRRNDGLARVFHDLRLMEREGSGMDAVFEKLLTSGRTAPQVAEGVDSVHVTVSRRVLEPRVIQLLSRVDRDHQLRRRSRIVLGLVAQSDEGLSATELAERLELGGTAELRDWLAELIEAKLIAQSGRTRGTRYFVPPALFRDSGVSPRTTLARVQPHRLRSLALEDLDRFPNSSITEMHQRIGKEVRMRALRDALNALIEAGDVAFTGERRWRRYRLADKDVGA